MVARIRVTTPHNPLLNQREIELNNVLGGFNEKGEELDLITAQVSSSYSSKKAIFL